MNTMETLKTGYNRELLLLGGDRLWRFQCVYMYIKDCS